MYILDLTGLGIFPLKSAKIQSETLKAYLNCGWI